MSPPSSSDSHCYPDRPSNHHNGENLWYTSMLLDPGRIPTLCYTKTFHLNDDNDEDGTNRLCDTDGSKELCMWF